MPESEVKELLVEAVFDKKQFINDKYSEAEKEIHSVWGNCIILSVKLKNGYVIVEHCICRDPNEFDLVKSINLCKEKVMEKLSAIYDVVTIEHPENIKKFSMKRGEYI